MFSHKPEIVFSDRADDFIKESGEDGFGLTNGENSLLLFGILTLFNLFLCSICAISSCLRLSCSILRSSSFLASSSFCRFCHSLKALILFLLCCSRSSFVSSSLGFVACPLLGLLRGLSSGLWEGCLIFVTF